jgi:hypothetical protein
VAEKLDELGKSNLELNQKMGDIAVKVEDFNIYDLFKDMKTSDGNVDASALLIQNLEKKIFKKFEFYDDKNKKVDDDMYKLKNESSNLKNQLDNTCVQCEKGRNDLKIETDTLQELIDRVKSDYHLADINLYDKIVHDLESKLNDIRDSMDHSDHDGGRRGSDEPMKAEKAHHEVDPKTVRDISKRLNELEKSYKIFASSINVDLIKSELSRLGDIIHSKANNLDIQEVKEINSKTYINH